MTLAFSLPEATSIDIVGTNLRFPVRRVFCVGRNYAAHAREMGKDPNREPPFFFTKFADAVVPSGSRIPYPPSTRSYHYEAELVVAINSNAFNVTTESALDVVYGYAAGLDMTRRDRQLEARDRGRPWDIGKNFAYSAPLGSIHRVKDIGHPKAGSITLTINDETRQSADLRELIWDCAEIIAQLSALEKLLPGDLIYTGTPSGVGPVVPGDRIKVVIEGLSPLDITIGPPEVA